MYIKRTFCFLIAAIILLTLYACGAPEASLQPSQTPSVTPVQTDEPTPTSTLTLIPTPTPPQVLRSYTTGIPITERTTYKPVGVIIDNLFAARPQYGLQAADIVYEAPVEGCTRFFCIYNDMLPDKVGPVRSARIYYIGIQKEWDCAFVHFGGPESGEANVYSSFSDSIKTRINFIKGNYNDYYWRDPKISAPHNAFTDVQKCQTLIKDESKVRSFNYADTLQYSGQNISEVVLPFYSNNITYKYDANKDELVRYMEEKPFKDAETGNAVTVKNLIVQYAHFYHGNEALGRWLCDLTGSGSADFIIGGKHISGTWERAGYDSPTIYKDSDGNEIVLQPGNTWIAVHPEENKIEVK